MESFLLHGPLLEFFFWFLWFFFVLHPRGWYFFLSIFFFPSFYCPWAMYMKENPFWFAHVSVSLSFVIFISSNNLSRFILLFLLIHNEKKKIFSLRMPDASRGREKDNLHFLMLLWVLFAFLIFHCLPCLLASCHCHCFYAAHFHLTLFLLNNFSFYFFLPPLPSPSIQTRQVSIEFPIE